MNVLKRMLCVWLPLIVGSSHALAIQPPPWTMYDFPPIKGLYEYRLVSGKNGVAALQNLDLLLLRELGCTLQMETIGYQHLEQDKGGTEENKQYTGFSVDCKGGKVWCYRVEDYHDKIRNELYVLYEVSKKGDFTPYYPTYNLVRDYNERLSVALSFVPLGAAQLYKGSYGKFTFFLGGEALFAGAAAFSWHLSNRYYDNFRSERNPNKRDNYEQFSRNAETCSYIFAGVAVGLYLWGVLDGIFADGSKKYEYALLPYATPNGSGVALSLNF